MRLLKVNEKQLADLAVANTKIRNVIVVPFKSEKLDGVFVLYDDLIAPESVWSTQFDVLGEINPDDVHEISISS